MVIIETNQPFEEYIKSLSRHAKKDWAYVQKHNKDVTYQEVPFVREEVAEFMSLWERQLIRGKTVTWAFPVEHLENLARAGELKVFSAECNGHRIALHFIQKRNTYWECHPPMYDKSSGSKRYLAKFMWFHLIKYGCDTGLGILDMGGGLNNWREMIKRRDEFPNPKYKWIYVPEEVKNNPEQQPNYTITETNGTKFLQFD